MNLYHGSGFDQNELMPGIKRSGKLVKWDQTESNEWLYAASTYEEAVSLGFSSVIEKHYNLDNFKSECDSVIIHIEHGRIPILDDLAALDVWVYVIQHDESWELVNNFHNGIADEYKTKETIKESILSKEKVDIEKWLSRKKVKIVSQKARAYDW